jgi:hypothetical protein
MYTKPKQQGAILATALLLLSLLSLLIINGFEIALLNQKALTNHHQLSSRAHTANRTLAQLETWLAIQSSPPEKLPPLFDTASIKLVGFIPYPVGNTLSDGIYVYSLTVQPQASSHFTLTATYFMRFDKQPLLFLPAYMAHLGKHTHRMDP